MDRRKLFVRFLLLMLFLGCVVSLLQPSSDVKFYESFDEAFVGRWTVSEKEDYKEASGYNLRTSAMLSDVLKKLDGKLKATAAQVENKNLELKKANDAKKKSSSCPICCRSDSSKSP